MIASLDHETSHRLGRLIDSQEGVGFPSELDALLARLTDYDNLVVLAFAPERSPDRLYGRFADSRTELYFRRNYFQGSYALDPYYQACLSGYAAGLYRLRDIAPDRFFQSEYHRAYYRFVGLSDEIGFLAPLANRSWLHLSLSRQDGKQPFGGADVRRLASYEPLLLPLMRRHWAAAAAPLRLSTGGEGLVGRILSRAGGGEAALTRREAEVTAQVLLGHSSTAIGLQLGISADTVKVHRRRIYRKLRISSQAELFARFISINNPGLVNRGKESLQEPLLREPGIGAEM